MSAAGNKVDSEGVAESNEVNNVTNSMRGSFASSKKRGPSKSSVDAIKSVMTEANTHIHHKLFEDNDIDLEHCGSRFVMRERNPVRLVWSVVLCILLGYTATAFLYRFVFCTFHIGPSGIEPIGEDALGWKIIDTTVDVLFWVDLFITFFLTYKDSRGREIDSLKLIAKNYLSCYFWINLVACLPEQAFSGIIMATTTSPEQNENNALDFRLTRVYRLQRISRLARLARVTRLIKLAHIMSTSHIWKWFQALRGVRVVNFIVGLFWALHLLACGWYLCAALHEDVMQTWVARRSVNSAGLVLIEQGPFEQWLVSMYFVLTVFTTVGFGDISAGTEAEIIYCALTMLVGAVVHSIIISEVIGIVTSTDEVQKVIDKQLSLIDAYTAHTQLSDQTSKEMKNEITWRAKNWAMSYGFDKKEMKDLITGKYMPRWLIAKMPNSIFKGELLRNHFLKCVTNVPPRLPCLLAVHLLSCEFEAGEVVYQMGDFPFNIFLVLEGTFAHVARPSPNGGIDAMEVEEMKVDMTGSGSKPSVRRGISTGDMIKALPSSASCELLGTRECATEDQLSPYRLFSHGSYFGDTEMLWGKPRFSTVRCERKGVGLTLHKSDFMEIKDMFPQFSICWASQTHRRERFRKICLSLLTDNTTARHLAASRIIYFWRLKKTDMLPEQSAHERKIAVASKMNQDVRGRRTLNLELPKGDTGDNSAALNALRREVESLRADIRQLMKEQRRASPSPHAGDSPPQDAETVGL